MTDLEIVELALRRTAGSIASSDAQLIFEIAADHLAALMKSREEEQARQERSRQGED